MAVNNDILSSSTEDKQSVNDGLLIRETIDGEPAKKTAARKQKATRSQSKAPARVSKADPYIWGIYILLIIVSVVELFSASASEVSGSNVYAPLIRHGLMLAIGFAIMMGMQKIHYVYFSRFAWIAAIGSLILLIYSSFFGIDINGAQRAIRVAGQTVQPAEIVKLTVVVLLAAILGRNQRPRGVATKGVVMVALVVLVFSGITWRNGLTNTILVMGVSVCMFLIGGIEWKKLGAIAIVYGFCVGLLVVMKYSNDNASEYDKVASATVETNDDRTDTHKGRLARFWEGVHPDDKIDDLNRQVIFANFAQAHGGLTGQGPGNSRESARLPLAFSDYIYSIIVEDTGFVGGVILLVLYLLLLARAGVIAYRCSHALPAFLIMGCAVLIVFQALVHMAIVTGVFPVSGQPLPLISKGGTSVMVMSAALGIMLSVSKYAVTSGDKKEAKSERNELPEDMRAANAATYDK